MWCCGACATPTAAATATTTDAVGCSMSIHHFIAHFRPDRIPHAHLNVYTLVTLVHSHTHIAKSIILFGQT